jgi:chromosome segregation ATPase
MTRAVSREKYEDMKDKAMQYRDECESLKDENESLRERHAELRDVISDLEKSMSTLSTHSDYAEQLDSMKKEIQMLKKDKKRDMESYTTKLAQLEREIMLKDANIQRLEDTRKDLHERYDELRSDYKDQQRWIRDNNLHTKKE